MIAITSNINPNAKVTAVEAPFILPNNAITPIAPIANIANTVTILAINLGIHWTNKTQRHPRPNAINKLSIIESYICKKFYFDFRWAVFTSTFFYVVFVGAQKPPNLAKLTVEEYIGVFGLQEVTTELGLHINCLEPPEGQIVTHTRLVKKIVQHWYWWHWGSRQKDS